MLRGVVAIVLAVASACALAPGRADAQDDARREARAAFASGVQAFEQDDYPLALEHFRRAFELGRHDAVRFNIAVCLERLGRSRAAVLEYDAAAASTALGREERARARSLAERARARLGTLVVDGRPEGTELRVDDEILCAIPCRLELDPGMHVISGAGISRREVSIARREEQRVEIEATTPASEPAPSETVASAEPERAPVVLDVPRESDTSSSEPPPRVELVREGWQSFGILTAVGASIAAVGIAGVIGFGIRGNDLRDQYNTMPSVERLNDAQLAEDLTNASIVVASVGAVIVAVDVILWLVDPPRTREAATARRGMIELDF